MFKLEPCNFVELDRLLGYLTSVMGFCYAIYFNKNYVWLQLKNCKDKGPNYKVPWGLGKCGKIQIPGMFCKSRRTLVCSMFPVGNGLTSIIDFSLLQYHPNPYKLCLASIIRVLLSHSGVQIILSHDLHRNTYGSVYFYIYTLIYTNITCVFHTLGCPCTES